MDNEIINLNKYISSSGFCSRRDADKLIEQARVTVNGELVLPGTRVTVGDNVEVDGEPIRKAKKRPIYIAFNKPVGVTSTTDVSDRSNIIYYIGHPKRIFPIGRLDKDSEGLIFLTNDGDIVNKILRASNNHEKEYIVSVDKAVTPEFVNKMSNGLPVLNKMTNKCFVRQEGSRRFRIILTQGLNRQIRRMCEYLGYKVVELTRVRVMNVELGTLPAGKWRYFTQPEIEQMNAMVATSSKTPVKAARARPATKDGREVQYIPKRKSAAFDALVDYDMVAKDSAKRNGTVRAGSKIPGRAKSSSGEKTTAKKEAPVKGRMKDEHFASKAAATTKTAASAKGREKPAAGDRPAPRGNTPTRGRAKGTLGERPAPRSSAPAKGKEKRPAATAGKSKPSLPREGKVKPRVATPPAGRGKQVVAKGKKR